MSLYGLYRLHHPGKYNERDNRTLFVYTNLDLCARSFYCFIDSMVNKWEYLITNNLEFWVPHFNDFAETIRIKCRGKGVIFDESFAICGFIDNAMNATYRAGSSPASDGPEAECKFLDIQRAWYNG